jgi:hypothetical protein
MLIYHLSNHYQFYFLKLLIGKFLIILDRMGIDTEYIK